MTQPPTIAAEKPPEAGAPEPVVRAVDAIGLIVGIVVGAGIFRSPSLVAANTSSEWVVRLAWILGGVVPFIGALVYTELDIKQPWWRELKMQSRRAMYALTFCLAIATAFGSSNAAAQQGSAAQRRGLWI